MVQGIRNAGNMLFSRGVSDDMTRLNATLGNLEKLSLDIVLFISLLHIEALKKVGRQAPYSRALSAQLHATAKKRKQRKVSLATEPSTAARVSPSRITLCSSMKILSSVKLYRPKRDKDELPLRFNFARSQKQHRLMALRQRLEAASAEISKAVELADSHKLEDLEWLAYWAGILREAKEQGRDVLGAINNAKSSIVECVQEDEFRSFVHRLEGLAWDVEYFEKLVHVFVNSVTSAVTGELTSRVFSGLVQRYGKDAATSEKLQRLEMLLIKINSALEASEKLTMNPWLLRWRDKLKEAASRGQEALDSFPQSHNDAGDTTNGNQQQEGEASSSSAAAPPPAPATDVGPPSFTKKSLSGMVQGIRNAGNMLFSRGVSDDMARLNATLGNLEKLSLDIGLFISLLHIEALKKVGRQAPYIRALSAQLHATAKKRKQRKVSLASEPSAAARVSPSRITLCSSMKILSLVKLDRPKRDKDELPLRFDFARSQKQQRLMALRQRLEAASAEISKAVELADSHKLEDLEEAKEQGRDVLGTINNTKSSIVECVQEDEFRSFVHRLEGLARDVEYFEKLVHVCLRALLWKKLVLGIYFISVSTKLSHLFWKEGVLHIGSIVVVFSALCLINN
ncbi:hypothetical protein VPH35_093726 [Triticum aestivum]